MRALVNTPNGPTPVEFRDLPEPQLQISEALVEVRAFSLNHGELTLFKNLHEGWRPGQDIAGTVLRSPDPASLPVGARVVAIADRAGWAERAAVPLTRIACLPDTVSFEDAAALPVAGITALRTLRFGDPLLGAASSSPAPVVALGRSLSSLPPVLGRMSLPLPMPGPLKPCGALAPAESSTRSTMLRVATT